MSTRRIVRTDEGTPIYPWLTAVVVPRPIAWVSTLSSDGVGNLAPHSFFTVSCAQPPIVQITSVTEKDTLRNIRETGQFVINLTSAPLMELVNATSAPFPSDVDEAVALGIDTEPSELVRPHRVVASPVAIECSLHSTVVLGDSTVIFGDVLAIAVDAAVLDGDHPRFESLEPLSRLGRNEWGLPPEVIAIDRPTVP